MNNSTVKKQTHLFGRIIRAILIVIAIYVVLVLVSSYFRNKAIEGYNSRRYQHEEPFKPWTGKAPPTEGEIKTKIGHDWAKANNVLKHTICKAQFIGDHKVYEKGGCSKYVTEENVTKLSVPIPKHDSWDDGTTTAECIAERSVNVDRAVKDMQERGDGYAASVWLRRNVGPDLAECQNFDNIRISKVVHQPQLRLREVLRSVRNGNPITDEERFTIQKDFPGVESFPPNNYRSEYMADADELFKISGGKAYILGQVSQPDIPDLETLNAATHSCHDYQQKIDAFKQKDKDISEQESRFDSSSQEWQNLNRERVANMDIWGNEVADAKAAGCIAQ